MANDLLVLVQILGYWFFCDPDWGGGLRIFCVYFAFMYWQKIFFCIMHISKENANWCSSVLGVGVCRKVHPPPFPSPPCLLASCFCEINSDAFI